MRIPVAALPSYDTPVINVTAALPGASPETMATSVAAAAGKAVLHHPGHGHDQFHQHAGNTSLTLNSTKTATSTLPRSTCRPRCCGHSVRCRRHDRAACVPQVTRPMRRCCCCR